MREIDTRVRIEAPPERVWEVLTDLPSYPEWNPFILELSGELRVGGRLRAVICPDGGKPMTFKPKVLDFEPARRFRWLGRLLLPRLVDGEHVFDLAPLDDGAATEFHHHEHFRGILVPLVAGMIEPSRRGFEKMNEALRQRAEAN